VAGGLAAPGAVAFIVGERGLCLGGTGNTARLDASAVLGHPLCLVALRFAIRQGGLLGQLIRVHDHKAERLQGNPPITILYLPTPHDTLPVPLAWGLLPGTARFCEQHGQGSLLWPPRFEFLAYRTGTWDQRDEPHPLLQAQSQRAFTVRFALRHHTTHPSESQRETCLDGDRRLRALTRVAVSHS